MNSLFVAARAVHYASTLLLFGELVFVIVVARPAWRRVKVGDGDTVYRRLFAVARWSLIASIASGAAWLAAQASVMSGVQAATEIDIAGVPRSDLASEARLGAFPAVACTRPGKPDN